MSLGPNFLFHIAFCYVIDINYKFTIHLQIYSDDDNDGSEGSSYKCVHEWKPHDGDLSCLMFLDDINNHRNE